MATADLLARFGAQKRAPAPRPLGIDDIQFMRGVGAAMYFFGALTLMLVTVLPLPATENLHSLRIVAGLLGFGVIQCAVVRHPNYLQIRFSVIYGIVVIGILMAVAHPIEATPFFYLWPMLFSAYFLARLDLVIDLWVMWISLGVSLFGFSSEPAKQVLFLGIGVSVTMTCVIVMFLRERLSLAIGQLEEHDPLTELPNRRMFHQRVSAAVSAAARNHEPVAIAIVDLDRFREINDTLGHQNGDQLLRELATRISARMHAGDVVARLGGDEFGLIIHDASDIERALWELRNVIEDEILLGGIPLTMQGSMGYVVAPRDGTDVDRLLQHADVAMYVAKEQHTGVVGYTATLNNYDSADLSLIGELRQAIDAGELVLHYQPQANIADGEIAGVEALVRWEHPTRGLLFPDSFLPHAEQTDLIEPLTAWVLRTAIAEIRDLGRDMTVSVNVSARSIGRLGLAQDIIDALANLRVDPERLIIEITETAFLEDPQRAADVLAQLAGAGVRVSLDDFGCGQTSLGYLAVLPLHELKIDRSFVTDVLDRQAHRAIVQSIIDLGHNLGLRVVGEGVETSDIFDYLHEAGCDTSQGYLHARPMPIGKLASWLRSETTATSTRGSARALALRSGADVAQP